MPTVGLETEFSALKAKSTEKRLLGTNVVPDGDQYAGLPKNRRV